MFIIFEDSCVIISRLSPMASSWLGRSQSNSNPRGVSSVDLYALERLPDSNNVIMDAFIPNEFTLCDERRRILELNGSSCSPRDSNPSSSTLPHLISDGTSECISQSSHFNNVPAKNEIVDLELGNEFCFDGDQSGCVKDDSSYVHIKVIDLFDPAKLI